MTEEKDIQVRVYGESTLPTLIYLPGLHGDWTLIGGFRTAVAGRVRFVEFTYPRTLTWSLEDYAAHVEGALLEHGITEGWLLGESFGSQVVWSILRRQKFRAQGAVLAGGFVRHPARWAVRTAERIGGTIPLRLITTVLFGYAKVARLRFRKSPEVTSGIQEFIERRTELDRKAAIHRLHLIFESDFCPVARSLTLPLYGIAGVIDPVVPWVCVRSWLRKHCTALVDYKVLPGADHNVLGTAPNVAADQIIQWMKHTHADHSMKEREKAPQSH